MVRIGIKNIRTHKIAKCLTLKRYELNEMVSNKKTHKKKKQHTNESITRMRPLFYCEIIPKN